MKIAIVGSREYENKLKIKKFIFECKVKFGEDLEIISGGQKLGADGHAKKMSNELEVHYVEFPPAHYPHNQYCKLPPSRYGKKYYVGNFFARKHQCDWITSTTIRSTPSRDLCFLVQCHRHHCMVDDN